MLLYLDAPPIRRSAKSSASARAMSPPRSAALNNRSNRPLKLNRINKSSHHMNMELQELKDLWRQHDEKLARRVKLNMHLLKKIELKNTRSALRKATLDPVFSLIFGFFMLIPLVPFIYNHSHRPRPLRPAAGYRQYLATVDHRRDRLRRVRDPNPAASRATEYSQPALHLAAQYFLGCIMAFCADRLPERPRRFRYLFAAPRLDHVRYCDLLAARDRLRRTRRLAVATLQHRPDHPALAAENNGPVGGPESGESQGLAQGNRGFRAGKLNKLQRKVTFNRMIAVVESHHPLRYRQSTHNNFRSRTTPLPTNPSIPRPPAQIT